MSSNPALAIEELSYAYGPKKALDQVSFDVDTGQCATRSWDPMARASRP